MVSARLKPKEQVGEFDFVQGAIARRVRIRRYALAAAGSLMVGMGVKTDDFHVVTGLTALTLGFGLAAAAAAGATNAGTNGADWTRSVVLAASDAVSMSIVVVGASACSSTRVAVNAGDAVATLVTAGAHAIASADTGEACAQIELDMGANSECDTGAGVLLPVVGAVALPVHGASVGEGEPERSVDVDERCAVSSVAHSVASRHSRGEVPVLVRGDEPAEVV